MTGREGIPYVDPFAPAGGPFRGQTLQGVHVTWPVSNDIITAVAPHIQTIKGVCGTGGNLHHARAVRPDIVVVYRDYRVEHPEQPEIFGGRSGAQAYVDRVWSLWVDAGVLDVVDYLEIMNEWSIPGDWYDALAEFSTYVAELVGERGHAILTGGFFPGTPEPEDFAKLYPYLRYCDGHPVGAWPDGTPRYHGVSIHLAGFMPAHVLKPGAVNWINNAWIAGRYRFFDDALRLRHQYSLREFHGPVMATELYWGYGHADETGFWNTEELQAGVRETTRRLSDDGIVDAYHVWSIGQVADWIDLSPHLPGMFQ